MITYGYAKGYQYAGDGTLQICVRIPSVHGPYKQSNAMGKTLKNYVMDKDLPWYPSLLLPHLPQEGEVVAIQSINSANNEFIVIGLTGGSYHASNTNVND